MMENFGKAQGERFLRHENMSDIRLFNTTDVSSTETVVCADGAADGVAARSAARLAASLTAIRKRTVSDSASKSQRAGVCGEL